MVSQIVAENLSAVDPRHKDLHIPDNIPGLGDLLISVDLNAPIEELERYQSVAENVSDQILEGVHGIGELLWSAGFEESDVPVSQKAIRTVGSLLRYLSEHAQRMQEIRSISQTLQLRQLEERWGKGGSL